MVIVKKLTVDVKTGREEYVEEDIILPEFKPLPKSVDFEDLKKIVEKAKTLGWL